MNNREPEQQKRNVETGISLAARVRRQVWRCCKCMALVLLAFLLICLVGLVPVNNGFRNEPGGIEIHVVSNAVHSDIVLPMEAAGFNWRDKFPLGDFQGDTSFATHVAIGWGDKGFFIETPNWSDLKAGTAANALLWPSQTCMHVVMADKSWIGNDGMSVRVTPQQYLAIVGEICSTFAIDDGGRFVRIADASYDWTDAFFEARGSYHLFNTCNSWIGRVMKRGGIRVGWFTPLPKTVFFWLPK